MNPGDSARAPNHRSTWIALVILSVSFLLPLIFYSIQFAAAERTLYQSDHVAYWSYSIGLARGLTTAPLAAVATIANTVAHQELNLIPATPVAVLMAVLGPSRAAYLISVIVAYGFAVIAALVFAVVSLAAGPPKPGVSTIVVASAWALLMLPVLWYPVFKGYLGLGGVALGLVVLALYLRRPMAEIEVKELLLLGFLVALLALFRRWYTIWSVSFCAVVAVEAVWRAWTRRGTFWRCIRPPLVIGVAAAASLLVLAAPTVLRRVSHGYGEEFVAYSSERGLGQLMTSVVEHFGLLTLAAAGAAALWLSGRRDGRRIAGVVVLHMLVVFVVMARLQDHGPQHWYLYGAGLLVLLGVAAARFEMRVQPAWKRRAVGLAACAVGMGVTAAVMVPGAQWAGALGPLAPAVRNRPVVRTDVAEVERLLGYLDAEVARRPGYIYVLGSSASFSDQALAFANLSLGTEFVSTGLILQGSHVDRRDGFPRFLLDSQYVVVASPPQVHLGDAHQQVVVIPTQSFLDGENVARAYVKMPAEFRLDNGVGVSVYARVRPILDHEIAELSDRLRSKYPDRPDIYRP